MSGTWYKAEQLGHRPDEIDNLGDKEKEQRFAEVAQNTDNCKGHASKVTECISNEDVGRIPVVTKEGQRYGHK